SAVSAISRAMATARARASVVFRDCERSAEYTAPARTDFFAAVRTTAGFWVVVRVGVLLTALAVDLARDFVAAAAASSGAKPIQTRLASAKTAQSFDVLINGQPLIECDTRVGRRRSF